jgi:long-subunit acyl-CoA synthetase (AMP-forming)
MTFLEAIFERLQSATGAPVVNEIHDGGIRATTGGELLATIQQARQFLRARGVKKGDQCALLAANSIRWIALDLALMAEGAIVVPLYLRQALPELVHLLRIRGLPGFSVRTRPLRRKSRSFGHKLRTFHFLKVYLSKKRELRLRPSIMKMLIWSQLFTHRELQEKQKA